MEATHHSAYCESMKAALPEKLFFTQHLPELNHLLDFGCADGSLLAALLEVWPHSVLSGYDRDKAMIAKCDELFPDLGCFNDYASAMEVMEFAAKAFKRDTGILFSSVLHEMHTEYTADEMRNFWMEVALTGTEYIIIRDMWSDLAGDEPNLVDAITMECLVSEYPNAVLSYEAQGGDLSTAKGLLEFQLKLPYLANWEHECREKYFSVPDLRPILEPLGYECILWDHHELPFMQGQALALSGIEVRDKTHLKAIFRRKPATE